MRLGEHPARLLRACALCVWAAAGPAWAQAEPAEAGPDGAPVPSEAAPASTDATAPATPTVETATERVEATGLDARVRRLSDALARDIKRMPGDWRDATFAVVRFTDVGDEPKARQLGLVVSDLVITNLVRDHRIALTERGAIEAILDEAALAQLGIVEGDGQAAPAAVQVLGAKGLIVGEVSDVGDAYRVSARLLDAATGRAEAAHDTRVPKAELIAYSEDAVVLKSKSAAMFRSLVAPGWGQSYNGDTTTAFVVGGTVGALAALTVGLLATGAITHFLYATWSADNLPPGSTLTKEQQIEQLQGLLRAAGVLYALGGGAAALTGVAWATGALEAYISGVDVESLDRARVGE